MTAMISYILLAEAIAQNSDGVLSAIGLEQNVVIARKLPARSKRGVVVRLEGDANGHPPADGLTVELSLVAPSGRVVMAQTMQAPLGAPRFPDLPWSINIPAEFNFTAQESGAYTIRAEIAIGAERLEATKPLYVRLVETLPGIAEIGPAAEPAKHV